MLQNIMRKAAQALARFPDSNIAQYKLSTGEVKHLTAAQGRRETDQCLNRRKAREVKNWPFEMEIPLSFTQYA